MKRQIPLPTVHKHERQRYSTCSLVSVVILLLLEVDSGAGFHASVRQYHNRIPRLLQSQHQRPSHLLASSNDSNNNDDGSFDLEERDWRAFRARLVQQDQQSTSASSPTTLALNDDSTATRWAYDAGMNIEVGTVLLSIPTTDLCQALEQQYFHRCVCLITHCDNENGVKGILLNRPTAFMYKAADDDFEWSLWFGGNMYENHIDDDSEITCLHSLTSLRQARNVSTLIERGLYFTNLAHARALVKKKLAKPKDFWCFGGHCKWFPGQLEQEMGPERGEWFGVSTDAATILEQLRQQELAGATAGLDMWELFVDRIDKHEEAISRIPSGQLRFYDRMLQAWVNSNLVLASDEVTPNITSSKANLGPGTIVRARVKGKDGTTCPPFLLSEQEFHRSLVLVLSDDETASIGVHLNLPLSGVVEISDTIRLPIRYGGPTDPEETDDEEAFVWIHRSRALQKTGEGTPLGKSGFSTIKEDDAVEALHSGKASPDDFMIFSGICIWEKDEDFGLVGGGLAEQVQELESMEVVSSNKAGTIWNLLNRQEVLTSKTLESNIDIAIASWEAASDEDDNVANEENAAVAEDLLLADAALRAWAAVSLLDEPTTTLIEVPEG